VSVPMRRKFGSRLDSLVHSIRFRLVLWFAVILVLVLATFSLFVYFSEARDVHADVMNRLESRMAFLEGVHGLGAVLVPDNFIQDNELLVLVDPNGNVLSSQGSIPATDVIQLAVRGLQEHPEQNNSPLSFVSTTGVSPQTRTNYQFLIAPLVREGSLSGFVILGSPQDPNGRLHGLILNLLIGCLLTLAIALGGGLWLADRAMRPVRTITQAAREIGDSDLSRRLNLKGRDELGELAQTFDAMLARLETAFERQRQFVADASHELRTPLTIVNLETTRALAARRPEKEYQRALGAIHSENDYMIQLVNDLLALARMDAGQANFELKPLDLSDVALDAVEHLAGLASRNGVRLETGELPEVTMQGDRQYLRQMIGNLIENGIKYTTGDERCIRVETGSAGGQSWVRVSDNGPGIAPEHLPHLFDRFYRVDQARARGEDDPGEAELPSGSGLGLSIVQWIARVHGGEVSVTSEVGQGTTFEVAFPAAESQPLPSETP
jgi:two-component system OmpR family sensor kinase